MPFCFGGKRKIFYKEVAMKKFFLFLLAAMCAVCLGAAAACAPEGDFYLLVFRQANGVIYDCSIPSGAEVKAGTEVTFKVNLTEDAQGTPVVYKNDTELQPDAEGVYSFTMEEPTTVKVFGVDAAGSDYNRVIHKQSDGVDIHFVNTATIGDQNVALQNGMLVKNGTEVSFTVSVQEGYYIEDTGRGITVSVAGTVLVPDGNGVYTFTVSTYSEIVVTGVTKNINVTFSRADTRVTYIDENGSELRTDTPVEFKLNQNVRFKVNPSVYYAKGDFEVLANALVLRPDSDGYYQLSAKEDTNISVTGLEQDVPFTEPERNGGVGTQRNPFHISRPIDLYQMSALVNSGFYLQETWRTGYYVLDNDIDLEGEQLFVIGTNENNNAIFAGNFNGNGHKISNFKIYDTFVEQEEFNSVNIANVGMFGSVMSLNGSRPTISNLRLENFSITADASQRSTEGFSYELSVGGIVGAGYGVDIINCSVDTDNGEINVTGGTGPAYVGGIIGQQVSYSPQVETADTVKLESRIIGCTSNATISVPSSVEMLTYATGGISGLTAVGEKDISSYIINSSFTGYISGGLHAGGITGQLGQYTSIVNCYTAGDVSAYSPFTSQNNSSFFNSYAGGIAGLLEYDAVIYNSFSASNVRAYKRTGGNGVVGDIAGTIDGTKPNEIMYGYSAGLVINSDKKDKSQIDENYIRNTLKWKADDWKFTAGSLPEVNPEGASKTPDITITLTAKRTEFGDPGTRTAHGYTTLAGMGRIKNGLPDYLDGSNNERSYGYYFDSDCKQKVPLGFLFVDDITLYVGSADYSQVAGTYYLGRWNDVGARITLHTDGTFDYRNGAVSHTSEYTYDGTQVYLLDTVIGELTVSDLDGNDSTIFNRNYNFGMTKSGDSIQIKGGVTNLTTSSGSDIILFPESAPLTGLKAHEDFRYGDYYFSENGVTRYTFNGNGTGVRRVSTSSGDTTDTQFNYVFTGENKLSITYNGGAQEQADLDAENKLVSKVNNKAVKPYDAFAGTWESSFGIGRTYNFDGMGNWTYGSQKGTYTIEGDGKLKDAGNAFEAQINGDGFVEITLSGKQPLEFYREGSFKGQWYFGALTSSNSSVAITLTLEGLGADGYGKAFAVYGSGETLDLDYSVATSGGNYQMLVFHNDSLFASLTYNGTSKLLAGTVDGIRNANFFAYDSVKGVWITDDDTLQTLNFNGNGMYNVNGNINEGRLEIKGYVTVDESTRVTYTFGTSDGSGNITGKFTYRSKEYTVTYNVDDGNIKVTADGDVNLTLQKHDEWYGKELTDNNGTVYRFDGRGRLTTHSGKVNIYKNGILDNEMSYKIGDGVINLQGSGGDAQKTYTIKAENKDGHQVYIFKESSTDGETKLYRNVAFKGTWTVGEVGGTVTISDIYADDTASGSFTIGSKTNNSVTFHYNPEGNYLSFEYDDGVTYYIRAINVGSGYNLSMGPDNATVSVNNYTCIPSEQKDEWSGMNFNVYNPATNENIGKLVFDGLGGSSNSSGRVRYLDTNGNVLATHTYTKMTFGYGEQTYYYARLMDNYFEYLLIPCKDENTLNGAYEGAFREIMYYLRTDGYQSDGDHNYGDHYWAVVYPDELFNNTIKSKDDPGAYYFFDGVGGVTRYGGMKGDGPQFFTYKVTINIETFIHDLELTHTGRRDEDNYVIKCKLDQSDTENEDNWNIYETV